MLFCKSEGFFEGILFILPFEIHVTLSLSKQDGSMAHVSSSCILFIGE